MKKIVITGVAGLLGSRMAEWILENHPSYTIIGIDDLSGGYQDYVPAGVDFHQLDLSKDTIAPLFDGADIVYHFAAYAAEGLSPFIRKYNFLLPSAQTHLYKFDSKIHAPLLHGFGVH